MRVVRLVLLSAALALSLCGSVLLGPAAGAQTAAHPLGRFTVNHYNGLRVSASEVLNLAVVDLAELPTLQAEPAVTPGYAAERCAALAAAQRLVIGGRTVPWRVEDTGFAYAPGEGGLRTSRLTCRLVAGVRAAGAVEFTDGFEQDRIGWREITVVGDGVRLTGSSAPTASVSRELRAYPEDLLADPLDMRTATFTVAGPGLALPARDGSAGSDTPGGGLSGDLGIGGPVGDALAALDRTFTGLIGSDSLTVPLGLLAVGLAVVLGAGHALIPGHGKTIMAAYLAGRRGRPRDALVVGATVTATHTLGVLVVGLLLSAFTALAGESVLGWLGVASGALIAAIGLRLFLNARKPSPHGHGHGHGHHFGHGHSPDHDHGPAHDHERGNKRTGLVGLGVAGGLVPSPSALVVLLGAIALGRTWFGVALVTAYGLGMATTLTVTGLILVKLVDRLERRASAGRRLTAGLSGLAPLGTAAMVVLLGAGLALRSAAAL
ncbi:nickel/cobalt transporter [Nonomuraea jiangxiensis]|uniref:ABC-type nickel/cobalt efflux system, permease component RcnA n=1 Tax=Nonomuraea jiangxiensis TaxID=633440 RepID=A0A1G8VCK6_9ACTN|nr:sulfite exporter TauE/SafE family protein [Nonomuraea jiangxiensis]SDJ63832.1 ABC-type nickel/cobalt efflux system, permease component RcnA [Nonomuraea jiangxiensis]